MANEDKVRNTLLRDVSSPPFPEFQLPLLARFKEESEKHTAAVELGTNNITYLTRERCKEWDWDQVSSNNEKLKKLFLDSNKVVKENKESISRFYEIIREQKRQKVKLEQEMLNTQVDIEDYEVIKETMEKYVRDYLIFENFLENVAMQSKTGDLLSTRDILNRYEALEGVRADLARILEGEMNTEAQLRQQMIELLEEKSMALKTLGNRLVMLQVSRRQAIDHRIYWEMMVQRIKSMILSRQEEMVVLRGACWDLYTQTCRRRRVRTKVPEHDINSQLDYIQKSIMFYKEVLTMATASVAAGGRNVIDINYVTTNKNRLSRKK